MIPVNPVEETSPPPIKEKEFITWNKTQIHRFLEVARSEDAHIPFLLAIYTGMRRGEVLGLKWGDIDFANKRIKIQRSLARTSKGIVFKTPKTRRSKRPVAISNYIVDELKNEKIKQDLRKESSEEVYEELDLIICTETGKPKDPRNLLRLFYSLIEKAQVPKISYHDLRHTHATLMLEIGENPKIVSERLGHSRVGITLDRYSHVNQDMQQSAAEKFEKALLHDNEK
ncbi:site-specific integrase [Bacillus marinisedimentorum]|uniref:site-specific integrase n=1 Tax=Bacillus marinisedimentorum TaxID=1821260 RepID=UPI0008730840|nr:site-specific integrase [Bacillus marinisedimentorum]